MSETATSAAAAARSRASAYSSILALRADLAVAVAEVAVSDTAIYMYKLYDKKSSKWLPVFFVTPTYFFTGQICDRPIANVCFS